MAICWFFASDRPGGLGGFDLYYSFKTASGWSDPVNFGPSINSAQDEYRPVVSDHPDFSNRLMIFSSNRPGGLGGFDLYYVGILKF
ncbi:PD40 domain-containing protein [Algoriphagus marinus]|uniref:PD40 domain-containing protein n=1 Tax=Algoriphagus marinus TaxID=1925762 RepID=UPI00094B7FB6|nr:PD40 domain-containing protein [Algoriphagus marinus]